LQIENFQPNLNQPKYNPMKNLDKEFKKLAVMAKFRFLKENGFPHQADEYHRQLDGYGLTDKTLTPLGLEITGRNLVQIDGGVVLV